MSIQINDMFRNELLIVLVRECGFGNTKVVRDYIYIGDKGDKFSLILPVVDGY